MIHSNTKFLLCERELMEENDVMLCEELRSMIKSGAPVSEVNSQIYAIMIKMDTVEITVTELALLL